MSAARAAPGPRAFILLIVLIVLSLASAGAISQLQVRASQDRGLQVQNAMREARNAARACEAEALRWLAQSPDLMRHPELAQKPDVTLDGDGGALTGFREWTVDSAACFVRPTGRSLTIVGFDPSPGRGLERYARAPARVTRALVWRRVPRGPDAGFDVRVERRTELPW